MSFYASQFSNKSSRYCNSNLYGSNLSTVYADGPPPLDDTLEEDDGEIVFRDKSLTTQQPKSKFDNEKSGDVSAETEFNPWSKNDPSQNDVNDDFGDFSGFADFSSAFGGESKSKSDSSWFKNGDNDQSSVTNFNRGFSSHQGESSASSQNRVERNEGSSAKDDDFGCFSGGDESDFDDFSVSTSSNQNTTTDKAENDSPKDLKINENSESENTMKSNEVVKNDKTIEASNDHFDHSSSHEARKSNFSSDDDFDEFHSSEQDSSSNGVPMSPTSNSHTQNLVSKNHSAKKTTCFSDDDNYEFGDFNSSGFDDDIGEVTKSPDVIIKSDQTNSSSQQDSLKDNLQSVTGMSNANEIKDSSMKELNTLTKNKAVIQSEHCATESSDLDIKKNEDICSTSTKTNNVTNVDQSKEESTHNGEDDDDDFGDFSTSVSSSSITKENTSNELPDEKNKGTNDVDDDFGDFGTASPSSEPNLEAKDEDFGGSGSAAPTNESNSNDVDDSHFGDFGVGMQSKEKSISNKDDDDEFGDFGVGVPSTEETPISKGDADGDADGDIHDDFGDFGIAPASNKKKSKSNIKNESDLGDAFSQKELSSNDKNDDDDEFGDFGVVPTPTSKKDQTDKDDDDEFGDFGGAVQSNNEKPLHNNDNDFSDFRTVSQTNNEKQAVDDDDFGDFGTASPSSEQNKNDNFGDFAEHKIPPSSNDDDEFGQFDAPPSISSGGFANFSSVPQKSTPSSFSTTSESQSLSNRDVQPDKSLKTPGSMIVIKPKRNPMLDDVSNPIKKCFVNNNINTEYKVKVQLIDHEVQSERSRTWQELVTAAKDGSLRFDWVLSEHQVKMLEGLLMLPVKIQTSVSFKPGVQVPTPLFASSIGLLEPVKGVITPFHHVEELNPSQDPFGAPPEVGVQDLSFDKGSKKETLPVHTETKDNISDTISVSSSLDLDFLAPSNTNGESTKTESRGLFEDDLLGLGMQFSEPSASPKITEGKGQKNIFKFNNTTISLATDDRNLSEQAKNVIKDFEDLSFMLSKVLMFPLKSKE